MKKNMLYLVVFVGLATGLWSCEYQLDSENFREIAPPDTTSMIQVSLSPFENQYMFTVPTWVTYDLNTFGLTVYNVEFFVGDQLIHSDNKAVGGFVFEPSPWGIGTETMFMVVNTGTNTGSLADMLEAESFVFKQEWEVLLDGGNPNVVEITSIENKDGILEIEWEEYERFNFQKYILYKNFGEVEWYGQAHVIAEITDPTQHTWQDSAFIGGTGIYWVEVYGSQQKATSQKQRFDFPKPQLELLWVMGDSASFCWTQNAFHRAVDHATVTMPDHYPQPAITLFSSENSTDTAFVANNLLFGSSSNYTLSVYPKTNIPANEDIQVMRSSVSFGIGSKLTPFEKFVGDPVNDLFYVYGDGKIKQYAYPETVIQDSCESGFFVHWFVSLYDQKLATQVYSTMKMYPSNDLQNSVSYDSYDLGFHGFWSDCSISANNRMVGPAGFGTGLYDLGSGQMLFSTDNNDPDWYTLSPDGKYVFARKYTYGEQTTITVWRVTATGFEAIGSLPAANYSVLSWVPDGGHLVSALKGNQFNMAGVTENHFGIFDAESLQEVAGFQVKVGYFSGIDPISKLVAFTVQSPDYGDREFVYVYRYDTGELASRVPLSPMTDNLYLYRSHLYSSKGFGIDISIF